MEENPVIGSVNLEVLKALGVSSQKHLVPDFIIIG